MRCGGSLIKYMHCLSSLYLIVHHFVFFRLWLCEHMVHESTQKPSLWTASQKRGKSCEPFMESAGNWACGKVKPDIRPLTIINITDFAKGNLLSLLESEFEYLIKSLLMLPKSTNPIELPVFLSNTSSSLMCISSNNKPTKFLWLGDSSNFVCSFSWLLVHVSSENPAPVELKWV